MEKMRMFEIPVEMSTSRISTPFFFGPLWLPSSQIEP